MLEWSRRRKSASVVGFQLKRWYAAEMPNSSSEVVAKTAELILADCPWARQTSTIPAAMASGKVPA